MKGLKTITLGMAARGTLALLMAVLVVDVFLLGLDRVLLQGLNSFDEMQWMFLGFCTVMPNFLYHIMTKNLWLNRWYFRVSLWIFSGPVLMAMILRLYQQQPVIDIESLALVMGLFFLAGLVFERGIPLYLADQRARRNAPIYIKKNR